MLNFLPVLILLMLQGSIGAELSPCQTHLLSALVQAQPRSAARDGSTNQALASLLNSPGGRQLARRGSLPLWQWAVTAILKQESSEREAPLAEEGREPLVRVPEPPPDRLSDGFDASARTRDGPF